MDFVDRSDLLLIVDPYFPDDDEKSSCLSPHIFIIAFMVKSYSGKK
jgi:hypothetical protein